MDKLKGPLPDVKVPRAKMSKVFDSKRTGACKLLWLSVYACEQWDVPQTHQNLQRLTSLTQRQLVKALKEFELTGLGRICDAGTPEQHLELF